MAMPTAHQNCPFCIENGKVAIIEQTAIAYLVAVIDNEGRILTGRYLIIPKRHVESVFDLPDNWQVSVRRLLKQVPEVKSGVPFNLSYNQGRAAGQRIAHVHAWVVQRSGEEGQASYELGLSGLIEAINK
jgi:diadenosine tetraphosphate (Ap4A) HIT family hydrolase